MTDPTPPACDSCGSTTEPRLFPDPKAPSKNLCIGCRKTLEGGYVTADRLQSCHDYMVARDTPPSP